MENKNGIGISQKGISDTKLDGEISHKARKKRQKLLARELLFDYANNTTLHGLPYVTRSGLTLMEKIFWLITFLLSISLCLYYISQVWFKWQIIVSISEWQVPVSMVPFPSVTICPQSKCLVRKYNYSSESFISEEFLNNRIYNIFLNKKNHPINTTMRQQIEKLAALKQICSQFGDMYDFAQIYPYNYSDYNVFKNILHAAPDYNDVFESCKIRGEDKYCKSLFNKVVTAEGICYNMNSLAAEEIFRPNQSQTKYQYLYANKASKGWSMEHGYIDSISASNNFTPTSSYYPLPGTENGDSPDVEIIFHEYEEFSDSTCNQLNSGHKVYLHHPTDLPQSSLYYYAVLNGQVSSMALGLSIITTSERLRAYDSQERQCYFPGEKYLKYFMQYTEKNCRLECLSNITYNTCGCVKFYMPHETEVICSVKNDNCVKKARAILQYQESNTSTAMCRCLPSCNSVDYEADILKTDYKLKLPFISYHSTRNQEFYYSKLDMYFKKPRFLAMHRSELFGTIDFLANCGGLLGLFLGFSFLSLIEVFYFLTLRLCCTLKKDLEEEKVQ